jgi:hypothetical protein
MRLIWKKYDSEFSFVLTVVGLGYLAGGLCMFALLSTALRKHPISWLLAGIPLSVGVVGGAVILVREYQLWKARSGR